MKKIAITGGIGSGKSLVGKYILSKGFPVFSCDDIYKELLKDDAFLYEIQKEFPCSFVNGALDKGILSSQIFSNEEKRARLNQITHPWIMNKLMEYMEHQSKPTIAIQPKLPKKFQKQTY